jgi:transcription elongation factor GreA
VDSSSVGNETLTLLSRAISAYVAAVPLAERETTARELSRFARWLGSDLPVERITPIDVARYQEQFPESSVDINRRLEPVKLFLTSLKTQKVTSINLGAQIRLRRPPAKRRLDSRPEPEVVLVTEEGFALLTAELQNLEKVVRPAVTDDLRRAAADKDFRENAPYDAAKQKLSEVQSRIDEIRKTLGAASIYTAESTETVDLGTIVTLHSLEDDEEVVFTIVGPGEVSPRDGKISLQSPVGKALADRRPEEIVAVQTPAGEHTYRVVRIERRK